MVCGNVYVDWAGYVYVDWAGYGELVYGDVYVVWCDEGWTAVCVVGCACGVESAVGVDSAVGVMGCALYVGWLITFGLGFVGACKSLSLSLSLPLGLGTKESKDLGLDNDFDFGVGAGFGAGVGAGLLKPAESLFGRLASIYLFSQFWSNMAKESYKTATPVLKLLQL